MEGSRHEKATLISVAYLLGALTIFIGYQSTTVQTSQTLPSDVASVISTQSAAVITASESIPVTTETVDWVDPNSAVSYQNGVLAITNDFGRKILSYNPVVSGLEAGAEFSAQGTHTESLIFNVATGDTYVFFCERKEDTASCVPYMYDSVTDRVYDVTVDSLPSLFTKDQATRSLWTGNTFTVPGYTVVDNDKPWLLLTSEG